VPVGGHRAAGHADGDQGAAEPELRAAARPQAQREQADRRQRGVERHLDAEAPHRRVEPAERRAHVVLREHREDRELACGRGERMVHRAQHDEAAGHRHPVGGRDARQAPQRGGGRARAGRAVEGGPDPAAMQQEPGEHEEQRHAEAQLAEQEVAHALGLGALVAAVEHPHVQHDDARRGHAAQAVQRIQAGAAHPASLPGDRRA
jgi:hypothetical protein